MKLTANDQTTGTLVTAIFALVPGIVFAQAGNIDRDYLTSETPLMLLSANDAEIGSTLRSQPLSTARDSITAIMLMPDRPPEVRTVYGTVPSSIMGPPRMAIIGNGRYGIVSNNPKTLEQLLGQEPPPKDAVGSLSIIDLDSPNLSVTDTIELPGLPQMVVAHPDGERFFVNTLDTLYAYRVESGSARKVASVSSPAPLTAFDISPDGKVVLASELPDSLHVFAIKDDRIEYRSRVAVPTNMPNPEQPFTVRIGPSGRSAIVVNGNGIPNTGKLDDALVVDLTKSPPTIAGSIEGIADGLEGIAIHPNGHLAVIGCLDDHLAVIDLTTDVPRLLYYLDSFGFPEGLEFSPDGSKLFVGLTQLNHIAVYDVDGFRVSKSPQVLHTGHSPTALAVTELAP